MPVMLDVELVPNRKVRLGRVAISPTSPITHPSSNLPSSWVPMQPPIHDEGAPTPAQRCSQYDVGGGVSLGDSFAIYSVVASPPNWSSTSFDPETWDDLEHALLTVTKFLPIHTVMPDNLLHELGSLPGSPPPPPGINPHHHPPWFLMNAARYQKHCVLGHNTALDSLLMVLQRPWCVLELCCCDASIVAAVHGFVGAAAKIDGLTYGPASRLLAHELDTRHRDGPGYRELAGSSGTSQMPANARWPKVWAVYAALAGSRLRSQNSLWVGLLCACAIYLAVPFSDLTRMLCGVAPTGLAMMVRQATSTIHCGNEGPWMSTCQSSPLPPAEYHPTLRRSKSDGDLRVRRRAYTAREDSASPPAGNHDNVAYLLDLYSVMIHAMGEAI